MPTEDLPEPVEPDSRFPSGKWIGFFLQPPLPGRQQMELILTFRNQILTGEGRDRVGEFLIRGQYRLDDGTCHWQKTYVKRHTVFYKGYNEGRGIWGLWEIPGVPLGGRGGFHIWPEAMGDPTGSHLHESREAPVEEVLVPEEAEVAVAGHAS